MEVVGGTTVGRVAKDQVVVVAAPPVVVVVRLGIMVWRVDSRGGETGRLVRWLRNDFVAMVAA